jgi:hypothetical protein
MVNPFHQWKMKIYKFVAPVFTGTNEMSLPFHPPPAAAALELLLLALLG